MSTQSTPFALDPLAVLGMNRVQPAAAQVLIGRLAGDRAPFRRILRDLAGRRGDPDDLRPGLHQRAVPLLAAPQRLLRVLAVGDRRWRQHHPGDLPVRITRGQPRQIPVPYLPARGDRLAGVRHRLAGRQHPARGGLGAQAQAGRPDLRGPAAQALARADAVQARPGPGSPGGCGGHRRGRRSRSAPRPASAASSAESDTSMPDTRGFGTEVPVLTGGTPYPCERVP